MKRSRNRSRWKKRMWSRSQSQSKVDRLRNTGAQLWVFERPGEDSTSSGWHPRVRQPSSHLDLYNLASMAFRSGGSHVESPVAVPLLRPLCRRGNTVPSSPAARLSWRGWYTVPPSFLYTAPVWKKYIQLQSNPCLTHLVLLASLVRIRNTGPNLSSASSKFLRKFSEKTQIRWYDRIRVSNIRNVTATIS